MKFMNFGLDLLNTYPLYKLTAWDIGTKWISFLRFTHLWFSYISDLFLGCFV